MSFDNNATVTMTGDAVDRWQVQQDLDLHDNPELAQRIADYMEHDQWRRHYCSDDQRICEDCDTCSECGRRMED